MSASCKLSCLSKCWGVYGDSTHLVPRAKSMALYEARRYFTCAVSSLLRQLSEGGPLPRTRIQVVHGTVPQKCARNRAADVPRRDRNECRDRTSSRRTVCAARPCRGARQRQFAPIFGNFRGLRRERPMAKTLWAVDPVRCELLSLLTGNLTGNSTDSYGARRMAGPWQLQ
ncbi:MAG: hypothetical protein JWQ49_3105 [Edaphobacter sp.]|nr:hypothetical protein [Edaphobacter sp.]